MLSVSANLLTTLNGNIAFSNRPMERIGSHTDWLRMIDIRNQHDAVLVGGRSARAGIPPVWLNASKTAIARTIILTRSGNFPNHLPILDTPSDKLFFCTPNKQVSDHLHGYPVLTAPSTDLADIFSVIENRNIQRLLIEGGGEVLAACIRANLVSTLYLTVHASFLDDAKAPLLFPNSEGGANSSQLHLFRISSLTFSQQEIFVTLTR